MLNSAVNAVLWTVTIKMLYHRQRAPCALITGKHLPNKKVGQVSFTARSYRTALLFVPMYCVSLSVAGAGAIISADALHLTCFPDSHMVSSKDAAEHRPLCRCNGYCSNPPWGTVQRTPTITTVWKGCTLLHLCGVQGLSA